MFVYKTHDAGSSTWAPYPTPKTCTSQMYGTVSVTEAFSWAGEMAWQVRTMSLLPSPTTQV